MKEESNSNEPLRDREQLKTERPACGPGCACNTGKSGRLRWLPAVIILVLAGVLVARAMVKNDDVSGQKPDSFAPASSTETTYPTNSAVGKAPSDGTLIAESESPADESGKADGQTVSANSDKPATCGELILSLMVLNQKAADKEGVFVFLAGQDPVKNLEAILIIEKSTAAIRERGVKIGVFTLDNTSGDFAKFAKQVPPPGVIAMAKGRGSSVVSGDITETKLIQAFVMASSAGGGCCPGGASSAGCN